MRDEFSRHRCLGQEWRRLLEAAEKTVSRSFQCLGFVVIQSVMLVERFVCFAGQNALLCGEDVWLRMCGCICVVLIIITCLSTQQRILPREINKQFDWHD